MARRLQFTRLRVSGFKSFSDPADLLIEEGLTGIVGPNGCGKSNIVEALRWVMGESSARGLRGTEMDDVIFAGSAFRAPFDLAEVVLKLTGPVAGLSGLGDEEEIEIGRRIGRGAGSAYRINGREARARDIQILFADAAAGSRSAAIVSQGQIGFIVDARPEDRRRLLEEAAGIGGLHGRRREAEIKLEHTEANLTRVVDLLARQDEQLAGLRKQAREAERYKRVSGDLRTTEALLLKRRHDLALAAAAAAAESVAAAERELGAATSRLAETRDARQKLAQDVERARAEQAAVTTEVARLEERAAAETEAAKHRLAERDAIQRRSAEASEEIARETRRAADLEARRESSTKESEALTVERARLASALEAATGAEAEATAALEELEAALAEHGRTESEVAARAAAARAQLEQLVERRDAALRGLAETAGAIAEPGQAAAIEEHERCRAALRDLEERRAALESEIATLRDGVETRRGRQAERETARQEAAERLRREETQPQGAPGARARARRTPRPRGAWSRAGGLPRAGPGADGAGPGVTAGVARSRLPGGLPRAGTRRQRLLGTGGRGGGASQGRCGGTRRRGGGS